MIARPYALVLVAAAAALACAAPARAQTVSVVVTPLSDAPDLGRVVVVGGGATAFSIDAASGAVTRLAGGSAIRLTTASATSPTVTLSCSGGALACSTLPVQISITAVAGSGSASITQFSVSSLSNATFMGGAPAAAATLNFSLNPIGAQTATFQLGTRVSVSGTATAGPHSFSYVVSASLL